MNRLARKGIFAYFSRAGDFAGATLNHCFMARRNVKAPLPLGSIGGTVELCEAIAARHAELEAGTGSPLAGQIDMADFNMLVAKTKTARLPAVAGRARKQALYEQALALIGIGKGQHLQVPDTIYAFVNTAHKFLKIKFKGNEEQASLWSFKVTVSEARGRRHVNFNIPYSSPERMLKLAEGIIKKHNADGGGSILTLPIIDMATFETQYNQAVDLRQQAAENRATSQANNQEARNLCGYGKGQNSHTPGTLYWYLPQIRNLLLIMHRGNEEQLETWGFDVTVSASTGRRRTRAQAGKRAFTLQPGTSLQLLNRPASVSRFRLAVTGGSVRLCTGSSEGQACGSGFHLSEGDVFEGRLADMGLQPARYLNGTNIGNAVAGVLLEVVAEG